MAPLTGLFGTNSSGKTSLLQILLLLKQTVESTDRKRVLDTGDERSLVDLGTFHDLAHGHNVQEGIELSVRWDITPHLESYNPEADSELLFEIGSLGFDSAVEDLDGKPVVDEFAYSFENKRFGMKLKRNGKRRLGYSFVCDGYQPTRLRGRPWPLPPPVKLYGFPDEVFGYFTNLGFLADIVLAFERLFSGIAYLGPLREYPKRSYVWAGDDPGDVGWKGELAVRAMLASKAAKTLVSLGRGTTRPTVEERIAYWLKRMGMIHSYSLKSIAKHRKEYELRIKRARNSPEVLITDVGFGVSQILPVLALCYHVPEGSVILLEQPEIHLHPHVQAFLADVFIEVVKHRKIQIILESHSEHLLRRLQRRIAEEQIDSKRTALYFCRTEDTRSTIERLSLDLFGNITNWPDDFFGDELGELAEMTKAEQKRRKALRDAKSS